MGAGDFGVLTSRAFLFFFFGVAIRAGATKATPFPAFRRARMESRSSSEESESSEFGSSESSMVRESIKTALLSVAFEVNEAFTSGVVEWADEDVCSSSPRLSPCDFCSGLLVFADLLKDASMLPFFDISNDINDGPGEISRVVKVTIDGHLLGLLLLHCDFLRSWSAQKVAGLPYAVKERDANNT